MDLAKDNCCPDCVSGIALLANIVRPVKLVWWRNGKGGSDIDADVTDAAAINMVSP